jgi:pilus assembly protein CpaB
MSRFKAVIPLVVALGLALITSGLIYKWVNQNRAPEKEASVVEESVPVAVAVTDLKWGTKLTPEMITMVPFFKESLPVDHIADAETLVGRVLIFPLREKESITESKLAPTTVTTGGVAAVVKPGKRAVAVKGDKVIGLSGLIRPGDRVDVLVTLVDPRTKREMTKLVLEDILVLATGAEIQKAQGKEQAAEDTSPYDVYALEVTPEEGERLALAASEGKLQFALRNATDTDSVRTTGVTIPKALSSLTPDVPRPVKSDGPSPKKKSIVKKKRSTVEVIKGSKVEELTF